MAWTVVGCDEAGYGPTLGPLCVGMASIRLLDADPNLPPPCLWTLLKAGICRKPASPTRHDRNMRVAVADSKVLKLPNDTRKLHPLVHLERGVLSFASLLSSGAIATDFDLLSVLRSSPDDHPCYCAPPRPLPLGQSSDELRIALNLLRGSLLRAKAQVLALRVYVVGEQTYNRIIRSTGNKSETTLSALGVHFREAWENWAVESSDHRLGIVCDRIGGRASYAQLLQREIPGSVAEVLTEDSSRSRYSLRAAGRRAGVAFLTEGESAYLPIALASMAAKLVRELLMLRFNEYWGRRHQEATDATIDPTAGYATDARRWLQEVSPLAFTPTDRVDLIRVA